MMRILPIPVLTIVILAVFAVLDIPHATVTRWCFGVAMMGAPYLTLRQFLPTSSTGTRARAIPRRSRRARLTGEVERSTVVGR